MPSSRALKVIVFWPDTVEVVEEEQSPPYVIVPATLLLKMYGGAVMLVGVETGVTSESTEPVVFIFIVLPAVILEAIVKSERTFPVRSAIIPEIEETARPLAESPDWTVYVQLPQLALETVKIQVRLGLVFKVTVTFPVLVTALEKLIVIEI